MGPSWIGGSYKANEVMIKMNISELSSRNFYRRRGLSEKWIQQSRKPEENDNSRAYTMCPEWWCCVNIFTYFFQWKLRVSNLPKAPQLVQLLTLVLSVITAPPPREVAPPSLPSGPVMPPLLSQCPRSHSTGPAKLTRCRLFTLAGRAPKQDYFTFLFDFSSTVTC